MADDMLYFDELSDRIAVILRIICKLTNSGYNTTHYVNGTLKPGLMLSIWPVTAR